MAIQQEIDFVYKIVQMNILLKILPVPVLYQQKDNVFKLVLLAGPITTQEPVLLCLRAVKMAFSPMKLTTNVFKQRNVQGLETQFQGIVCLRATAIQMFTILEIPQPKCAFLFVLKTQIIMAITQLKNVKVLVLKVMK